jgi:type IV secretion system protein VirB1
MDLLALVMACGPLVAPATAMAVIDVESGAHPYAIHDNTDRRAYAAPNLTEAVLMATMLLRAGHRLDLGIMQVNYEVWIRGTRLRLEDALDPCTNIGLGTTILSAAYGRALAERHAPAEAMMRALSVYHSGDENRARDYADSVLKSRVLKRAIRASETTRSGR